MLILKKIHQFYTLMPSDPIAVSSALKTTNFPYGMPMNFPKGQVGASTGVVGTNDSNYAS
jgi:hypothetical protein